MWLEHSTQYQFLATRLLRDFIKYSPGKKPNPVLSATLAAMKAAANWFVKPGGRYALLGDTAIGTAPDWGYNRGVDPQGLKTFDESGFAMVRDGGSYLATTSSFFNITHKHADELDFDLFDRGVQIVNGPGNYGYDRKAEFRDYQLSSQSHSVLVVDGKSFPLDPPRPHGSGIRATGQGAGWYAIEGTNPLVTGLGVRHSRLFLYRPGRTLAVVDRCARTRRTHTSAISSSGRHRRDFVSPGMLGLTGPGFEGGLHDDAAAEGEALRVMVRGRRTPLQGVVFPGFRRPCRGGARTSCRRRRTPTTSPRSASEVDAEGAAAGVERGEHRDRVDRREGRSGRGLACPQRPQAVGLRCPSEYR